VKTLIKSWLIVVLLSSFCTAGIKFSINNKWLSQDAYWIATSYYGAMRSEITYPSRAFLTYLNLHIDKDRYFFGVDWLVSRNFDVIQGYDTDWNLGLINYKSFHNSHTHMKDFKVYAGTEFYDIGFKLIYNKRFLEHIMKDGGWIVAMGYYYNEPISGLHTVYDIEYSALGIGVEYEKRLTIGSRALNKPSDLYLTIGIDFYPHIVTTCDGWWNLRDLYFKQDVSGERINGEIYLKYRYKRLYFSLGYMIDYTFLVDGSVKKFEIKGKNAGYSYKTSNVQYYLYDRGLVFNIEFNLEN